MVENLTSITTKAVDSINKNFVQNLSTTTVLLIFLGIIVFLMLSGAFLRRFRSQQRSIASGFGRIEHWAGRMTGVLLILNLILAYFKYESILYPLIVNFFIWLLYLIAHTLEKATYNAFGGRGFR